MNPLLYIVKCFPSCDIIDQHYTLQNEYHLVTELLKGTQIYQQFFLPHTKTYRVVPRNRFSEDVGVYIIQ
jgi:hypothetical protein